MRYKRVTDGEWVKPRMKGYRMMCCDCGLVHVIEFRIIKHARGHKVLFRAVRHEKATATARQRRGTTDGGTDPNG